MGGQFARIALQLLSVVILARLLSPDDYGLVAMVTALIGVGEVFRDFGLSSAAIQAKTLSQQERSNLFWVNSAIGVVLTLSVFALSAPIAEFYGQPDVQGLTQVLAFTFLINGVATQFRAALTRSMKLGKLTISEIVGQAVGLLVGVGAALSGAGYWSLAAMQIAQALSALLMTIAFCRWIPGLYSRSTSMRPFLGFGGYLVAAQLLTYASRNVDSVIIGGRMGPEPLGIYNRAFQLLVLPLNQVNAPSTRVALPTLSKLQDEPARYARFILAGQTVMLNLVAAIFAFAAAQADSLVNIFLGDQWTASVLIFQVLAIAGVFQTAGYATYWVFLSKGLTRSQLFFSLATRPVVILLIVVGANWGILGVAIAYSAGVALSWPVGLFWLRRSGAPVRAMFLNGVRATCVYSFCFAGSFVSTFWIESTSVWLRVLVGAAAFVASAGVLALLVPPFRRDITTIVSAVRLVRKRGA